MKQLCEEAVYINESKTPQRRSPVGERPCGHMVFIPQDVVLKMVALATTSKELVYFLEGAPCANPGATTSFEPHPLQLNFVAIPQDVVLKTVAPHG